MIGIVYGAVVATMQMDLKRLVAYSSVAHMGFIVLGTFAFTTQSLSGAVLQMINHGVSTGALFLLVGMIYERRSTRKISELKGIQQVAPIFAAGFMLVMLSSIGVPGLNGFVGEFLILIGSFLTARWWTVVAAAGVILAALYLLWAYQRVFHGEPDEANKKFREISLKEGAVLLPFLAAIVFMGVYPKPVLDRIEPSIDKLIGHVEDHTDYVAAGAEDRDRRRARVGRARRRDRRRGGRVMLAQLDTVRRPRGRLVRPVADAHAARRRARHHAARRAHPEVAERLVRAVQRDHRRHRRRVRDGPVGRHHRQRADHARRRRDRLRHAWRCSSRSRSASPCCSCRCSATRHLRGTPNDGPEIYALYMVAAIGGVVMASANDLIVLFLGLETLSLALVRARREQPPQLAERGGRHQVLRARRLLVGVLPLRHRAGLRRHRARRTSPRWSLAMQTTVDIVRPRTRWRSPASPC